jgi:hypothetical protein
MQTLSSKHSILKNKKIKKIIIKKSHRFKSPNPTKTIFLLRFDLDKIKHGLNLNQNQILVLYLCFIVFFSPEVSREVYFLLEFRWRGMRDFSNLQDSSLGTAIR